VSDAGSQRIRWYVTEAAAKQITIVRELRGEPGYFSDVRDLREFLGAYVESAHGCTAKQGKSISPVGALKSGGKILKVRWTYPGAGKSGGLRMCFVAFCDERKIVLCHVSMRRDVEGSELIAAANDAEDYAGG
jgi:hypothetical protein